MLKSILEMDQTRLISCYSLAVEHFDAGRGVAESAAAAVNGQLFVPEAVVPVAVVCLE